MVDCKIQLERQQFDHLLLILQNLSLEILIYVCFYLLYGLIAFIHLLLLYVYLAQLVIEIKGLGLCEEEGTDC